ncbi:MerR HTH family regulatory protein [Cognatiyoonia koreensis]|uniref:MerR HTH family regulatory protein n=1 Tax=Cognatiyoonia koreensis TaxID=364200 RepID=A0A1I0NX58_9RHOB|nr:MerR family transcriptional regulator [Cognatiyoonia koreensis]SEW06314.1 MerR HTH family regulatory protein [Cognatiyoonia koreensis]
MAKAPDAFRTISEVSDTLDTPAHVLRFWESKFSQIKPVKRAGGRRYYRPEDVALLAGIKTLLHTQGMTIKGAQKLLREKGIKHVQGIGIDGPILADQAKPATEAKSSSKPDKSADKAEKSSPIAEEIAATEMPEPVQQSLEISNITAFRRRAPDTDPGPQPPARAVPDLPPNPSSDKAYEPRYFGNGTRLDDDAIKAQAAKIAPLLARLETVRDQMRKS